MNYSEVNYLIRSMSLDNAIVGFDETRKTMLTLWAGAINSREFNLVYKNVLKGFKIYFANTLISDFGKVSQLGSTEIDCFVNKIMPQAVKCGLRKLVIVNSSDLDCHQLSTILKNKIQTLQKKIQLEIADSIADPFEKKIRWVK